MHPDIVDDIIDSLETRNLIDIVRDVAVAHHVTPRDIAGTARYASIVRARHEAWRRIRDDVGLSYPHIASLVRRDHSSIIHGVRMARERAQAAHAPDPTHDTTTDHATGTAP